MPQYLSTDPNAGQDAPKYLSTDPNAGTQSPSDDLEALRQKSMQQANSERVGSMGAEMARDNPNAIYGSERFRELVQPRDPEDEVLKTGTLPQKIHRAAENTAANLAPAAMPVALASTVPFLTSLAGGAAGRFVGKHAAEKFGASPDWSDVAGDVGGLAGNAAGFYGGSKLGEIDPSIFRDEVTGKLKPGVRTVARVGGGAVGGTLGSFIGPHGSEVGTGLGVMYGPQFLDSILPDIPDEDLENAQIERGIKKGIHKATIKQGIADKLARAANPEGKNPDVPITRRLSPLIYENEAQANQIDALNARLKDEASKAGMYSAARGRVSRPLDYQQRIGRRSLP